MVVNVPSGLLALHAMLVTFLKLYKYTVFYWTCQDIVSKKRVFRSSSHYSLTVAYLIHYSYD